jgi:hypothetical protein
LEGAEVKISEYSAELKGEIHPEDPVALAPVLFLMSIVERPQSCVNTSYDDVSGLVSRRAGRVSMRFNGKTLVKSSHDLILIIGAVIAIAMLVSKMVHNWRNTPAGLGMTNATVMVAEAGPAPH